jgi:hypothetical protein
MTKLRLFLTDPEMTLAIYHIYLAVEKKKRERERERERDGERERKNVFGISVFAAAMSQCV